MSEDWIAIISASFPRRRCLRAALQTDYLIFEAVDCTQAKRLLAKQQFSVVICDVQLPDGDWKDVLNMTTDLGNCPRVLVVAPADSSSLWAEVLNLGGYDVLLEPLDPREIKLVVGTAMRTSYSGAPMVRKTVVSATKDLRHQASGEAILVIDDDDQIRSMLQILIKKDGYDVILAENGVQAVEMFQEQAWSIPLVIFAAHCQGQDRQNRSPAHRRGDR